MSLVELGLGLDLGPFLTGILAAEKEISELRSQASAGVTLRARLDTSSFLPALAEVRKTLAKEKVTLKVATEFYRVNSGNSISAKSLKEGVLKTVQQTVNGSDDYKIKIGTTFQFDKNATRQIKSIIKELDASVERFNAAKAAAASGSKPADVGSVRQRLADLTNTESKGGLNAAELRRLQNEASKVGIKSSATGATELRKELREEFLKAGEDAIKGLAKGLIENPSSVLRAGSKLVDTVIKGFKDDLGIRSPSKKTADEIGKPMADGVGKGFVDGMVAWERRMAASIRQAVGNAVQQGLARDQAARGALMNFGKDAGTTISTSLTKALKQGLASSIVPAIKGGLVGGTGGFATGGLVGAATAAGGAIKQAVMPAMTTFGYSSMPEKLGMLGKGSVSMVTGQASDAFNQFLQSSVDSVLNAALSSGGQGALLGAAGVAGVAGLAGLAKGTGGSLVSQAVESIKNRILGTAVQQAQAQAQLPGSTAGAVVAPIENAGNVMGLLRSAIAKAAQGVLDFAENLSPGKARENVFRIGFALTQAAEQFQILKKETQILGGKIKLMWTDLEGTTPQRLLPPRPVPGTGLIRERNIQLGDVVGRTPTDFGGQYIEQTRKELKGIFGKPGEWNIVDQANGVWQGIKTDSQLARERLRLIANALTTNETFLDSPSNRYQNNLVTRSRMRVWTDREGVGAFNPFDPAFYRGPRSAAGYSMGGDSIPNARTTLGGTFGGSRRNSYDGVNGNPPSPPNTPFRRATQVPPGALALRNVPVEFFTSFRDAEKLLATVEQRLADVAKAFGRLGVVSQLQVDQSIRSLAVSLRAVQLAFQKGEIGASDLRAATYGAAREMAGLEGKSAEIQNLAQAFENLGIQSRAAVEALQDQRNIDLKFIEDTLGSGSSEATRARNARDIQQLNRANDLVRTAQGASGFGGFRGREIGNDILNRAEQRSVLANAIREMKEYSQTLKLTETNAKTFQRVQAALNQEIGDAERAFSVLNGTAKAGETITNVARNAWGTILDDFQNLVPQLLVFAVAYNLILQRVLTTPGAVIQAAASFDRLETSISSYLSATRGIGDATGEIDKLRGIALDLGIGFEKAASSYLRFAAATQGTALEGQETEITRTLATAGRNQGLSGEQIDRASTALTQILSKGRVQSEELRGQLAEQLPGALQVAARAFGVTTKELYRMVEAGQIAGDEFVGKFIQQLKAEGATANQLSGSFSNVTEQFGSSIQALAAAAGQPFLAPLTVALQVVNATIQTLIPVVPVLTGLIITLGAAALKAALNNVPLAREIYGATMSMVKGALAAAGYGTGLSKLAVTANVAKTALIGLGKAALIGLSITAVAKGIEYLRGEVGSLGDELKKVRKIADGGIGNGLSWTQKQLGQLNLGQNINDRTTLEDSKQIASSTDALAKKVNANKVNIKKSIDQIKAIDTDLFKARLGRDTAKTDEERKSAEKLIKTLEDKRKAVEFIVSPEDIQTQIGAMKAAEDAVDKVGERFRALGREDQALIADKQVESLKAAREEFERLVKQAGLLDSSLMRVQSLAALQSRLRVVQESIPVADVNSKEFRNLQLEQAGLNQAIGDQQLLPQEQRLISLQAQQKLITAELQKQDTIAKVRLGRLDSEKKLIEANLSLEQARTRLQEAVFNRRAQIARAVGDTSSAFQADAQGRQARDVGQSREIAVQAQLIDKERERSRIETGLQREQIRLQQQQITIDTQMLEIERVKLVAASKVKGVSDELFGIYIDTLRTINATISAVKQQSSAQAQLLPLLDRQQAAQEEALNKQKEQLMMQADTNRVTSEGESALAEIELRKERINAAESVSLAATRDLTEQIDRQIERTQTNLDLIRATVEAQRERLRMAEELASAEMEAIDRTIDMQTTRSDGGFFERMAKLAIIGNKTDADSLSLAERRAQLMRQIKDQQDKQKIAELGIKQREIEAEKILLNLKVQQLRLSNEEARIRLRATASRLRMAFEQRGDTAAVQEIDQFYMQSGYNNSGAFDSALGAEFYDFKSGVKSYQDTLKYIGEYEETANKTIEQKIGLLKDQTAFTIQLNDATSRLLELDASTWFAKFLDQSTSLGRVLSSAAQGLSEFRQSISSGLVEGLLGGDGATAISNAGKQFSSKLLTSIVDEYITKPMEQNLFTGLAKVFGLKQPETEQQVIARNTERQAAVAEQTKTAIGALNQSLSTINQGLQQGFQAVVAALVKQPLESGVQQQLNGAPATTAATQPASPLAGTPIKGAMTNRTPDRDGEATGWDITVPGGVGGRVSNPFGQMRITGTGFHGRGSGPSGKGYGNWVSGEVEVAGKIFDVLLGHFQKLDVKKGDILGPGATIGQQGVTGRAFGAHVTTHVNPLNGASVGDAWNVLEKLTRAWESGTIVPASGGRQPALGPQSSKPPIGDQFLSQILGGQYEDIAQGGARSAQNAPSAAQGLRILKRKVDSLTEWTLQNTKDVNSVGDVDFPGRRQPTLGKSVLTRPTGAMIGLAIGGELGDLLIEYINSEFKKRQKVSGPQSSSAIGDQFTRLLSMDKGLANVASGGPVPVQVVNYDGGSTRGWSGESYSVPQAGSVPQGSPPVAAPQTPDAFNAYAQGILQLNGGIGAFTSTINLSDEKFASLWQSADAIKAGFESTAEITQRTPSKLESLNTTIGGVAQVLGGLAMGVAGFQQAKKGGAYNTLMGLAGIFGSIGSIAGMFGTGGMFGPKARAMGGPVVARKPYIVGELGPELFLPETNGSVVSNSATKALMASRMALGGSGMSSEEDAFSDSRDALSGASGANAFNAARSALEATSTVLRERQTERVLAATLSAPTKGMDIKYEAQVINNVEYVTAEQFRRGLSDAAERGRALTLGSLRNSVTTRRKVGI